jgi:hypothetical protein
VSHFLLQDPRFFELLLRVDQEFARQTRAGGCMCGGVLHRGNYPRKPRGCLPEARSDFESRFSFCCSVCRKRTTSVSVRFLGRRVSVDWGGVVWSAGLAGQTPAASRAAALLDVPVRTLVRWRCWWQELFPLTVLWRGACARFMPPIVTAEMPTSLLACFTGEPAPSLLRMLVFLSPLTGSFFTFTKGR